MDTGGISRGGGERKEDGVILTRGSDVKPMPMAPEVATQIQTLKRRMPKVYEAIHRRVATHGTDVFALVRRGMRGDPNCFYAFESGNVVGTPFFDDHPITAEVARTMVRFGVGMCVIWGTQARAKEDMQKEIDSLAGHGGGANGTD